jgi:hypothetical protein
MSGFVRDQVGRQPSTGLDAGTDRSARGDFTRTDLSTRSH